MEHHLSKRVALSLLLILLSITSLLSKVTTVDTRFYSIGSQAVDDVSSSIIDTVVPLFRGYELYHLGSSSRDSLTIDDRSIQGFGIDILAEPLLWASFGNFKDPVKMVVGVTPRLRLYGWRGFMFDVRSYLAFYDEITQNPGYLGGTAVLSQIFKVHQSHWITGSFGWFTAQRWGVDFDYIGLSLNNSLIVEMQLGYTGKLAFENSIFNYSKLGRLTSVGRIGYIFKRLELYVELEGGHYLNSDWGGGGTLLRKFGVVDISFTVLYTQLGANGGFAVRVPLWFKRHPQVGRMRVGLYDSYSFRYRLKQVESPALIYETEVDLKQKLWEFNGNVINSD